MSGKNVCMRCLRHGLQCLYGFANRSGKPKGSKNRATLRKLGQLQENKPPMRGFRGSRPPPVVDREPLAGRHSGHIANAMVENDVSPFASGPMTSSEVYVRSGLLDPWSTGTLGESSESRQCSSTGDAHMPFATDRRWLTLCRSDGLVPYSTRRFRIPPYASDPKLLAVRPFSRRISKPTVWGICILTLSRPVRMCRYAAVPYEPTQSSTRRIPTSQIRSQSPDHQGHLRCMPDIFAVWQVREGQCELVTCHIRAQSDSATVRVLGLSRDVSDPEGGARP